MGGSIPEKVRLAGVVGAGGAGFPTHAKLQAKVDRVLANGASCEPLLMGDPFLMEQETEGVLRGLALVMEATGASRGTVCLKGKHRGALEALGRAAGKGPFRAIDVFELGDFYPAGDEQVLVYEVLRRVVPEGGIPLQVGAVVSNVETLYNVARAVDADLPVTERYLTVTGEVRRPMVVKVPVGMSVGEVLAMAGGAVTAPFRVVLGGPMMGRVTGDMATPVDKTTSGILVFAPHHTVVAGKTMDPDRLRHLTAVACCQCTRCTDLCPRHLLGHALRPHALMRSLGALGGPAPEGLVDALICSECGICEKYACPLHLSPREVNGQIKRSLLGRGVKRPPTGRDPVPSAFRDLRRIPTARLVERLDLGRFEAHPPWHPEAPVPAEVTIPLKQHLGAPARPVVKEGDRVRKGDLLGEIPEGALGARVHASMDGVVLSVGERIGIGRPSPRG